MRAGMALTIISAATAAAPGCAQNTVSIGGQPPAKNQ